jgi:hypothetical protein
MKKFSYKNTHCLLDFIPDEVDGQRVYNVHLNGEHSIYMTEEFVKALMDDSGEGKNIDQIKRNEQIFLVNNNDDGFRGNILNQKIILDLPKNSEEPLKLRDFYLASTRYSEKLEETLTVRLTQDFLLFTKGDGLIFKFANNDIETKTFYIRDMDARGKTIIDIDSEDGVCDSIMINALKNTFNAPNIYFSFKGLKDEEGKPSSIFVRNFGVSTIVKGDDYCYPKFSTSSLYLRDGSIGSKTSGLTDDFIIKAKDGIFMLNTNLTFEPDESNKDKGSFGIEAKKMETQDIDGEVKGSLIVSKELEIESKGEKSYIDIKESKIDGAFVYKNIDRKRSLLRLQNVNADLGNSYLQCQSEIELENVTIKNNDKIGFKNVSLYCSEVKKVFQLIGVNACYTSFDNVYVGNTETDSLSYLKIGDKNDSPDSSILHTFKNVNIYLEGADTFIVKGGNALSFTSCDFDGNTYIETKSNNPSIFYKVSGVNSKFTNSSLRFSSHDGSGTIINNSEIEGDFVCDSVREIAASYLENVKLESLDRVDSCYLSAYIYENDGKRSNLINVNSNEEKILPKDTKLEIL